MGEWPAGIGRECLHSTPGWRAGQAPIRGIQAGRSEIPCPFRVLREVKGSTELYCCGCLEVQNPEVLTPWTDSRLVAFGEGRQDLVRVIQVVNHPGRQ